MMSWSDMREGDALWVSFGTFCSSALWGGNKKKRWGQCTEEQKKRWKTVTSAEHVDAAAEANKWADQRRSSGFRVRNGRKHFFSLSSAAFSSSVAQAAWQSIAMRSGPQLTRNSAKTTLCFFASQSAGMPVKILMWPADSVYLELPQRARCQRASAHARPPLYISWPTCLHKSEPLGWRTADVSAMERRPRDFHFNLVNVDVRPLCPPALHTVLSTNPFGKKKTVELPAASYISWNLLIQSCKSAIWKIFTHTKTRFAVSRCYLVQILSVFTLTDVKPLCRMGHHDKKGKRLLFYYRVAVESPSAHHSRFTMPLMQPLSHNCSPAAFKCSRSTVH